MKTCIAASPKPRVFREEPVCLPKVSNIEKALIFLGYRDVNEENRRVWLEKTLLTLPPGARILDAGAGELRSRPLCNHLDYTSQDFCQYDGKGDGKGQQTGKWDTSRIDLVCDITDIPVADASFDAILCSEVLEHLPDPIKAIHELARLLKPAGKLILTAPFGYVVHFAPFHYYTGFTRYWYEFHITKSGFCIEELTPNGDWFAYCRRELMRLGYESRRHGDWSWPLAYVLALLGALYFKVRGGNGAADLACFGWHCLAVRTG